MRSGLSAIAAVARQIGASVVVDRHATYAVAAFLAGAPGRSSTRVVRSSVMSTIEQPEEPVVQVYAPDEARKHARPLPSRDKLVVEDVTDEEWKAFQEALADA